jgi:hypothetical protein
VRFRVVLATLDVHGRQDVRLLPWLKQRTQQGWGGHGRHGPRLTREPAHTIPTSPNYREAHYSCSLTTPVTSSTHLNPHLLTKFVTNKLAQDQTKSHNQRTRWSYALSIFSYTCEILCLLSKFNQNRYITMTHLRNRKIEAWFVLFKIGSLLEPQVPITSTIHNCSSQFHSNLKWGQS